MASLFGGLFHNKEKAPYCAAVVAAAGSGRRMGEKDKLLLPLGDMPVIAHTLKALEDCPMIMEIIVVTREDLMVEIANLCKDYDFTKVRSVVVGGETRTLSVSAGLRAASPQCELIAIHDGGRPFVTGEVLETVIMKAARCGAAAPVVPVKDTIKMAVNGIVEATPDRTRLFAVQTPQVFEASLIRAALKKALEDGVALTDDCAAVERLGMKVALTPGSEENIKLTTPLDMLLAESILERREA